MRRPPQPSQLASSRRKAIPLPRTLSLRNTSADPSNARLSYQQQRIQVLSKLDPTGYSYHVLEVRPLVRPA